jgi:manganese/zinc/iron transport system substrate-binding protein
MARGLPTVVATTGMIAGLGRRIGGSRISGEGLMGPGLDPHSYRQTRSDVASLARADLVLWHGLYLEAQMEDLLHDLGRKRDVVAVAEALPKDLLHAKGDGSTHFDPHVWMSPRLWSGVIAPVTDALSALDPDGAPEFAANAADARAEFEALAVYADKALASIPEHARLLVTAHDAFSYFGRAFGLEVAGIQGMSTESEAGLARIETLVKLLVDRDVGAVFVESSVPERNVRALIEGAQAQGRKVIVGGELFSDAMGPEGTYEGTYPGMIDHNITVIARALGGDAPELGLRGLLSAAS